MSYHLARRDFRIESIVFLENVALNDLISSFLFCATVELILASIEFSCKGVIPDDGIK